jgi:hypothetical protein
MRRSFFGRLLRGLVSATGVLVGTLPLLSATAVASASSESAVLALPPVAPSDDQDAAILQAAQMSLASTLQHGVSVGDVRLKLSLSPSNVGVSWLLPL